MLHKKTIFIISISIISLILLIIIIVNLFSSSNQLPYLITLPLQSSSSFSDISSMLKNNIKTIITASDKKQEIDLFLIPKNFRHKNLYHIRKNFLQPFLQNHIE